MSPIDLSASPIPLSLPLFISRVPAGFPSPADDYIEAALDLNERLIPHPAASFFVVADGHSMVGAGIFSGDLLIVDRSLKPRPGDIVIASLCGELTVKRYVRRCAQAFLVAENPEFQPIQIQEHDELLIWGVVTYAVHTVR